MIESVRLRGLKRKAQARYVEVAMKPEPLFYIVWKEQSVAGPYDLVQMAGLLRKKIITADTSTRLEGQDDWKPFSWQPQFSIALEMPPGADSLRVEQLDAAAEEAKQGPIPMPSAESMMKLAGLAVGTILAGVASFAIAWLDSTTGYCLAIGGGAAALVATCMITAQLLDEDYWTLAFIFFVPFGTSFYFISNFWKYFPWFCVRFVGAAVCFGGVLGLAAHAAH